MRALELIDGWPSGRAVAGVVGPGGVLATRGDTGDRRPWASVTKLLTAMAVLVAVEEGTIGLDDPAGPPGATVRHLLAHASGLAFEDDQIHAPPGRRRIYSSRAFEVLAAVLAERAGMPFERYLRDGVLTPLGMGSTELGPSAAASMEGPLDDLLKFAAELRAPTLISDQTLQRATSVAYPGLDGVLPGFGRQRPLDWGLGFEIKDGKSPHWTGGQNSPGTFGHFGNRGSFLWVDPGAQLALAVLSGSDFDQTWVRAAWPALSDAVLVEFG